MSYTPTVWIDHVNSGNRYNISNNDDGTKEIVYAGEVLQQGTPMSAENFNHMEQGIWSASQTADEAKNAAYNIGNVMNLTGTRITTLEQKTSDMYSKSEVFEIIVQKVAEIVAGAPADFDTLKEMYDWMISHADSAADMNTAITKNSKDISLLEEKIDSVKSNVALNKSSLGFQRKNLLKNTAETKTINGVTFTVNEDGSVTVNGTAAATTNFHLNDYVKLEAGRQYILTGCPEGGDTNSSYRLYGLTNGGNWVGTGNDTGSGSLFTSYDFPSFTYRIVVYSGATVDNLTFYPMIRDADITDSTFEPYTESVVERLDRFGQQELLYSIDSAESPLTVNIPGLFKNYSVVICQINTSTYTMRYNLTLPLRYIKSLGTGSYYSADSQLMFEYVDDNNIKIITGMAQSNPTISNVKIIGLY